jgi:glycosyltransferase involved in cell wall biosynthesis
MYVQFLRTFAAMKISILCQKDQAGSGMMFVRALRSQGHEAMLFTRTAHEYGYEYDVLFNMGRSERKAIATKHILNSDVIHFKGDQMPFTGAYKILKGMNPPPSVITFGGSGFRRRTPDLPPETCLHWYPVSRYRGLVNAMSAITPDLMYREDIRLTPHAYPDTPNLYRHRAVPVLGHSPSNRGKKGTDTLFLPAVQILRDRGVRFDLRVIEKQSNADCVAQKAECSVFFDQGVLPAYGMSAVEAMMMGIPVVTRMTKEVKQRDPAYTGSPLFLFDEHTPEVLADVLEEALTGDLALSNRLTHEWAMSMHSYAPVAARLAGLYNQALTSRCTTLR